jgi:RNA polymerase sigma-70 factor (ECF subfamily)
MFDRRWALTILEQALVRLQQEFTDAGKGKLFESLKATLTGEAPPEPYAVTANKLDISEQAVKVAVHRLRRRYGELLRAEIAQTVSSAEEIEDELRDLFAAVKRK